MARKPTSASATSPASQQTIRCAVYTRKSTEEGLDQEFNSLDAQYEACTAYVASQRHEGWSLCPKRYDDGGFSGGNMERPGLKRLLVDVAAGHVQVVVLYKVDRLTRRLADFSKIVDVLDAAGASFVSVTQAFNTTTSMGRLMLNVLLSFAQFEREVTGERIRDKVAASKKKGMWMGGIPPLGYDVHERQLIVNEAEAVTVRYLFDRYLALKSGTALLAELREQGYRTKLRVKDGKSDRGGMPFTRSMLFHLLANRTYRGQVEYQGEAYAGMHKAIVINDIFDAVQEQLKRRAVDRTSERNIRSPSLLTGLVRDGLNRRMTPNHSNKQGKRYRYYATASDQLRQGEPPAWRLPAYDLEAIVVERLRQLFTSSTSIREFAPLASAAELKIAIERGVAVAERLITSYGRTTLVATLVQGVQVDETSVRLLIHADKVANLLALPASDPPDPLQLIAPTVRLRRGKDVKLVFAKEGGSACFPDQKVVALLKEAAAVREAVMKNPDWTMRDAASALKQCRHRLAQLVRLSFLSPKIVEALSEGRHTANLAPRDLLVAALPLCWSQQESNLDLR